MKVTVKLFGTLRRFSHPQTPGLWTGEVEEGATLRDLIVVIGASHREVSHGSLNGRVVPLDTVVSRGVEIILVTPMGGG